jgi:hypothetical protein
MKPRLHSNRHNRKYVGNKLTGNKIKVTKVITALVLLRLPVGKSRKARQLIIIIQYPGNSPKMRKLPNKLYANSISAISSIFGCPLHNQLSGGNAPGIAPTKTAIGDLRFNGV